MTILTPAEQAVLPVALRRESQAPVNGMAGMDHGDMAGMDHGDMAGMDHGDMAGMDHGDMAGMDHGDMAGMDHGDMAGMDHGDMAGMDHGDMAGMDHGDMAGMQDTGTMDAPSMSASAPAPGLTETLDAYLAVHDALASDRLGDATAQATALASAFETLTATPPADNAHLWHMHADDLAAVRTQTAALASATDLDAARTAFGTLSVPMIRLVQAVGVPAEVDLALMSCGMAPGVPQGGVWMQRPGTTANPFFGAAMPTCGSRTGSVSGAADANDHSGH